MSQVDPEKLKADKKNTDLWKQKQEEKKKKKETESTQPENPKGKEPAEGATKADKKKEKARKEQKQQRQKKDESAKQQKMSLPTEATEKAKYSKLSKIDKVLSKRQKQSRVYQQQLIIKEVEQCISPSDTILYIGNRDWTPSCQHIHVKQLNKCVKAELVCSFTDLMFFLESTVTKIFIQADYIFGNGSILARSGALTIALVGKRHNIPVIAVGGSWNYCGWAPVNNEALEEQYGESALKEYDWIQDKHLRSTVMEVGVVNARQVAIYPPIIYKNVQMDAIEW